MFLYIYPYLLALNLTTIVFIMKTVAFLLGRESAKTAFRPQYWQKKAVTGGEIKMKNKNTGFYNRFHKNAQAQ